MNSLKKIKGFSLLSRVETKRQTPLSLGEDIVQTTNIQMNGNESYSGMQEIRRLERLNQETDFENSVNCWDNRVSQTTNDLLVKTFECGQSAAKPERILEGSTSIIRTSCNEMMGCSDPHSDMRSSAEMTEPAS